MEPRRTAAAASRGSEVRIDNTGLPDVSGFLDSPCVSEGNSIQEVPLPHNLGDRDHDLHDPVRGGDERPIPAPCRSGLERTARGARSHSPRGKAVDEPHSSLGAAASLANLHRMPSPSRRSSPVRRRPVPTSAIPAPSSAAGLSSFAEAPPWQATAAAVPAAHGAVEEPTQMDPSQLTSPGSEGSTVRPGSILMRELRGEAMSPPSPDDTVPSVELQPPQYMRDDEQHYRYQQYMQQQWEQQRRRPVVPPLDLRRLNDRSRSDDSGMFVDDRQSYLPDDSGWTTPSGIGMPPHDQFGYPGAAVMGYPAAMGPSHPHSHLPPPGVSHPDMRPRSPRRIPDRGGFPEMSAGVSRIIPPAEEIRAGQDSRNAPLPRSHGWLPEIPDASAVPRPDTRIPTTDSSPAARRRASAASEFHTCQEDDAAHRPSDGQSVPPGVAAPASGPGGESAAPHPPASWGGAVPPVPPPATAPPGVSTAPGVGPGDGAAAAAAVSAATAEPCRSEGPLRSGSEGPAGHPSAPLRTQGDFPPERHEVPSMLNHSMRSQGMDPSGVPPPRRSEGCMGGWPYEDRWIGGGPHVHPDLMRRSFMYPNEVPSFSGIAPPRHPGHWGYGRFPMESHGLPGAVPHGHAGHAPYPPPFGHGSFDGTGGACHAGIPPPSQGLAPGHFGFNGAGGACHAGIPPPSQGLAPGHFDQPSGQMPPPASRPPTGPRTEGILPPPSPDARIVWQARRQDVPASAGIPPSAPMPSSGELAPGVPPPPTVLHTAGGIASAVPPPPAALRTEGRLPPVSPQATAVAVVGPRIGTDHDDCRSGARQVEEASGGRSAGEEAARQAGPPSSVDAARPSVEGAGVPGGSAVSQGALPASPQRTDSRAPDLQPPSPRSPDHVRFPSSPHDDQRGDAGYEIPQAFDSEQAMRTPPPETADQGQQTTPDKGMLVPRRPRKKRTSGVVVQEQEPTNFQLVEVGLDRFRSWIHARDRPKRHNIRPLEHWRNEAVIYERKPGSAMPTVAGVMIACPIKDDGKDKTISAGSMQPVPIALAAQFADVVSPQKSSAESDWNSPMCEDTESVNASSPQSASGVSQSEESEQSEVERVQVSGARKRSTRSRSAPGSRSKQARTIRAVAGAASDVAARALNAGGVAQRPGRRRQGRRSASAEPVLQAPWTSEDVQPVARRARGQAARSRASSAPAVSSGASALHVEFEDAAPVEAPAEMADGDAEESAGEAGPLEEGFVQVPAAEGCAHPCEIRVGLDTGHWMSCDIKIPPRSFNTPEVVVPDKSLLIHVMEAAPNAASIDLDGDVTELGRGDSLVVRPGQEYCVRNKSAAEYVRLKLVMVSAKA
eukprot:TRINITY_DN2172_c0_g1_i1.p1 TRINITY_DN2172_c0_g1~~TRINITY_DN2172_c0_g1_i1.p1  ORF type:complete len:1337 (-),score=189.09 TRINITY_DN2172_c0_g1_i1:264-4274(-)